MCINEIQADRFVEKLKKNGINLGILSLLSTCYVLKGLLFFLFDVFFSLKKPRPLECNLTRVGLEREKHHTTAQFSEVLKTIFLLC